MDVDFINTQAKVRLLAHCLQMLRDARLALYARKEVDHPQRRLAILRGYQQLGVLVIDLSHTLPHAMTTAIRLPDASKESSIGLGLE